MTREEVAAVTDTAHRHGVKVTAHSGSTRATLEAIEAGIDCVEHGYFLTDDVLKRMIAKGVWLVPTIVVSATHGDGVLQEDRIARLVSRARRHRSASRTWTMLQNAIKHGVKIALGTDQFPYEPNDGTTATIREAQYYVEAGMTPLKALALGDHRGGDHARACRIGWDASSRGSSPTSSSPTPTPRATSRRCAASSS